MLVKTASRSSVPEGGHHLVFLSYSFTDVNNEQVLEIMEILSFLKWVKLCALSCPTSWLTFYCQGIWPSLTAIFTQFCYLLTMKVQSTTVGASGWACAYCFPVYSLRAYLWVRPLTSCMSAPIPDIFSVLTSGLTVPVLRNPQGS